MVDRTDPGGAGVVAGKLVGVLTAAITVATLLDAQSSWFALSSEFLGLLGIETAVVARVWFWGTVGTAALTRYGLGYVVGSLVGVLYDWLDSPPRSVLIAIVATIGMIDAGLAFLDTLNVSVYLAYVLAWLAYIPVFAWAYEETESPSGPRRLGEN